MTMQIIQISEVSPLLGPSLPDCRSLLIFASTQLLMQSERGEVGLEEESTKDWRSATRQAAQKRHVRQRWWRGEASLQDLKRRSAPRLVLIPATNRDLDSADISPPA